jgi:hypothetical protein
MTDAMSRAAGISSLCYSQFEAKLMTSTPAWRQVEKLNDAMSRQGTLFVNRYQEEKRAFDNRLNRASRLLRHSPPRVLKG